MMRLLVLVPCLTLLHYVEAFFLDQLFKTHPGLEAECDGFCRPFISCWLSGGVITETCGGIIQYCCEEAAIVTAEARKVSHWKPVKSNHLSEPQELHFGAIRNDPACGRPSTARRRVVGGTEAGFGNFPWQALIRVGSSRCGGALVSRFHVVTAGHCVYSATPYSIRVYLGEYSLYRDVEPLPREKYAVTSVELHPYYRFTPQADRYDIAILKLDRRVRYQPHISPVCLPLRDEEFPEGTNAMVAGWGAIRPDSPQRPRELQVVDVETVESRRCERWHRFRGINVEIFTDMLCAGHEIGGRDACQGDSGGPLMLRGKDGRWTLIGIVSAGYSCAKPGQPGIYHRVSKTSDWVSYHITYGQ